MSIPLREIYNQFRSAKIRGGQKSKTSFSEIERFLGFLESSEFSSLTQKAFNDFLEIRRETLGDYAAQQCYQTIRHFSKYAHVVNSENERLPKKRRRLKGRRIPNILSAHQVAVIIAEMDKTCSGRPLSARTYSTLVGLLYVTGMRISEALVGLSDADVNLDENFIYVAPGKSPTDRYVPITEKTSAKLAEYRELRERYFPGQSKRFFMLHTGAPRCAASFRTIFNKVTAELGYRAKDQKGYEGRALVPHDLRHSYATRKVLEFHRAKLNVNSELPKLATILGHESSRETYWYIQSVPEIAAEILKIREAI